MSMENLTSKYVVFLQAADELYAVERKAKRLAAEIENRISAERTKDAERIAALEKELHDTPREELRRVLDEIQNAKPEVNTAYWVNYYRGSDTGARSDQKKSELQKRAEALRNMIALNVNPVSAEETELAELRNRHYSATPTERVSISGVLRELDCKWSAVKAARDELREAFLEMKDALDQISMCIDGKESAKRNEDYNAANDALKALL